MNMRYRDRTAVRGELRTCPKCSAKNPDSVSICFTCRRRLPDVSTGKSPGSAGLTGGRQPAVSVPETHGEPKHSGGGSRAPFGGSGGYKSENASDVPPRFSLAPAPTGPAGPVAVSGPRYASGWLRLAGAIIDWFGMGLWLAVVIVFTPNLFASGTMENFLGSVVIVAAVAVLYRAGFTLMWRGTPGKNCWACGWSTGVGAKPRPGRYWRAKSCMWCCPSSRLSDSSTRSWCGSAQITVGCSTEWQTPVSSSVNEQFPVAGRSTGARLAARRLRPVPIQPAGSPLPPARTSNWAVATTSPLISTSTE